MINNLAIDQKTGDLLESVSQIREVTGLDALAQGVVTDLKLFLSEYWLDRNRGVPYIQVIFQKQTDLSLSETILRNEILRRDEVVEITNFVLNFDTAARAGSVIFSAKTTLGDIQDQEIVI